MCLMATPLPEQIGRYRIERLLGSGSMGFVYLGRDPELGRRVAIKTIRDLHLDADEHARFLQRFKNEARIAAQLQHPNIVQIHDVGEDEDIGPYLVFEYVPGSTLKTILKDGPLPPEQIVQIAEQVAAALEAAHAQSVVHRDIKPDNLFVNSVGVVKLGDFGIARVPNADLTKEGQFLGTPCYSAPETLRDNQYGPETDLFSLAAVIYEAACGQRAFEGTEAVQVARNILHKDPIPPSKANAQARVPPRVDAIVMRGLAKQPADRYETAASFASALRSAYGRAGLLPREQTGLASASAPKRSLLFFLSILLIGAIFALLVLSQSPNTPFALPGMDTTDVRGLPTDKPPVDPSLPAVRPDAAVVAIEPSADGLAEMTSHEREEAAKDELSRARAALRSGDLQAAQNALDQAARYDPGNPDIEELRAQLPSPAP